MSDLFLQVEAGDHKSNTWHSNLIPSHAHATAMKPQMWGGRVPDAQSVAQLTAVLTQEWTRAVDQMLRHWSVPPIMGAQY